jgi:hypothetical protein
MAAAGSLAMRKIGTVLCLVIILGLPLTLGACFVQHAELIGVAEPAQPDQWNGSWVAEPLEAGGEPGFFAVADVDPAQGSFTVSDADADGNPIDDDLIALHLRRVGDTLFLDARDRENGPWMLFVVAEMSADRIVLAWKPRNAVFQQAIVAGELAGQVAAPAATEPDEIVLQEFTPERQEKFALGWQNYFTAERIVLRRMATTD